MHVSKPDIIRKVIVANIVMKKTTTYSSVSFRFLLHANILCLMMRPDYAQFVEIPLISSKKSLR